MRVLVVEDSDPLRESLCKGLRGQGFAVDAARDGETGLDYARNNPYDVLVLDLMLPKLDGWGVLRGLDGRASRPHVLVLTARDQVEDRVEGLNLGADDYLVKPFHFEELVARVHALVRRRYTAASTVVRVGDLEVDPVARCARWRGEVVEFSAREYALLEYLASRQGQIVTREEIEDHIYGVHHLPASNAVDKTVCVLRGKLGVDGKALLRTRRGQGYMLGDPAA